MQTKKLSEEFENYIIEQRRYFHQNPELPFEEWKTTEAIEAQLKGMGIEPHRIGEEHPGVYALIEGGKAGANAKTILLRADIDALPVTEKTGLPFASQNPGVMHACGHDCHIAMLLGAAKILKSMQSELPGNVKLIFQPAEELALGAPYCVSKGMMDGVDAVYGCHIMGKLDAPHINVEEGPRLASADLFEIEVHGVSSHGSAPQTGKDALIAAASIVMNLQTFVSRMNDPLNPLVITVGTIQGGQRFNIIASHVKMDGTVRTHSNDLRNQIEAGMRNIIEQTAAALGCTATLKYDYLADAVINDPHMTDIVRKAAVKLDGESALATVPKAMGSEDFSAFMAKAPGAYAMLGGQNTEMGYVAYNHNDQFTVDESALKHGTALYAQVAIDYLSEG